MRTKKTDIILIVSFHIYKGLFYRMWYMVFNSDVKVFYLNCPVFIFGFDICQLLYRNFTDMNETKK